jgi:hypothetical protein
VTIVKNRRLRVPHLPCGPGIGPRRMVFVHKVMKEVKGDVRSFVGLPRAALRR